MSIPLLIDAETDAEISRRSEVFARFRVENIQWLEAEDLTVIQNCLGHGARFGIWETPKILAPGLLAKAMRAFSIEQRIRSMLSRRNVNSAEFESMINDAVLICTRLGILMRLVPTGGRSVGKVKRLKPSSIAVFLYSAWPKILAIAIERKAQNALKPGLLSCLTQTDVAGIRYHPHTKSEIDRLNTLVARGVWSDDPDLVPISSITDPSQKVLKRPEQRVKIPFEPLPDDWLAEIGPRVLWMIEELGPNLLDFLEQLPDHLISIELSKDRAAAKLVEHLMQRKWLANDGSELHPPFRLTTSTGRGGACTFEWPPRNWEHIQTLALTLQSCHLFVALLSCAGRIGEVATLRRNCVLMDGDSKSYVHGRTYKLSGNLFGDTKQWPAPDILCKSLGQQKRLASAMDWLPQSLRAGQPLVPRFGEKFWVSIGIAGDIGEHAEYQFNGALVALCKRLDMDPKPGGPSVHAHRFRKTIGRLAGIALWRSPLVLKRLFGHKSIEMTLGYILSDPAVRQEAERVLRELRIMHCADVFEEVHCAMKDCSDLPANGGNGAMQLVKAVREKSELLAQSGRLWGEGSAYELAFLFTAQGQGWRLIQENIVCSKIPGESGLCRTSRSKGEPDTANCQPQCDNRIVLMRRRRDTESIIEQYLNIARQARDDGQMLVLAGVMENVRGELANFADIRERYLCDVEVRSFFELCEGDEALTKGGA